MARRYCWAELGWSHGCLSVWHTALPRPPDSPGTGAVRALQPASKHHTFTPESKLALHSARGSQSAGEAATSDSYPCDNHSAQIW